MATRKIDNQGNASGTPEQTHPNYVRVNVHGKAEAPKVRGATVKHVPPHDGDVIAK